MVADVLLFYWKMLSLILLHLTEEKEAKEMERTTELQENVLDHMRDQRGFIKFPFASPACCYLVPEA